MRQAYIIFLGLFLFSSVEAQAQWENRITEDRGGHIGEYVDRYQNQKSWHQPVIIDGLCASACTLVLANVATEHVCVTKRAVLGFHAAFDYGPRGTEVTNPEATQVLLYSYPAGVRRWIASKGGLTRRMIWLKGRQLERFIPPCMPQTSPGDQSSFASLPGAQPQHHGKKKH